MKELRIYIIFWLKVGNSLEPCAPLGISRNFCLNSSLRVCFSLNRKACQVMLAVLENALTTV